MEKKGTYIPNLKARRASEGKVIHRLAGGMRIAVHDSFLWAALGENAALLLDIYKNLFTPLDRMNILTLSS